MDSKATGGSEVKASASNAGDLGSIPGLGRSPGEGNGNPLQYSCHGESHGQRSLVGYSPWGCKESTSLYYSKAAVPKSRCALDSLGSLKKVNAQDFPGGAVDKNLPQVGFLVQEDSTCLGATDAVFKGLPATVTKCAAISAPRACAWQQEQPLQ